MKHAEVVRVKDVMKIEFDLIHGIETVADALRAAKHLETECMLVNRRHDDDEYGIVLLSDIAKKVLGADRAADRTGLYAAGFWRLAGTGQADRRGDQQSIRRGRLACRYPPRQFA